MIQPRIAVWEPAHDDSDAAGFALIYDAGGQTRYVRAEGPRGAPVRFDHGTWSAAAGFTSLGPTTGAAVAGPGGVGHDRRARRSPAGTLLSRIFVMTYDGGSGADLHWVDRAPGGVGPAEQAFGADYVTGACAADAGRGPAAGRDDRGRPRRAPPPRRRRPDGGRRPRRPGAGRRRRGGDDARRPGADAHGGHAGRRDVLARAPDRAHVDGPRRRRGDRLPDAHDHRALDGADPRPPARGRRGRGPRPRRTGPAGPRAAAARRGGPADRHGAQARDGRFRIRLAAPRRGRYQAVFIPSGDAAERSTSNTGVIR